MYIAPTLPLQVVHKDLIMNNVTIAGGIGYIAEEKREDLFSCGILCNAPKQKLLKHDWDDNVGFKLEAWGDDAARLRKHAFKGRQVIACGTLRYDVWEGSNGTNASYKVRTRAGHYQFFGKNKDREPSIQLQQKLPEVQVAPTAPEPDNIPF